MIQKGISQTSIPYPKEIEIEKEIKSSKGHLHSFDLEICMNLLYSAM
jgi:hypothetical protein